MEEEKSDNIVNCQQVSRKKKCFLLVSDEECVLECWAHSHKDLAGIINVYDERGNPHRVSMIIDVSARRIYETAR